MTKFLDGPAAGVTLELRRAPQFLRVVRNRYADDPHWDALDQLHDRPGPNEWIYAYRLVQCHGHVCIRRAKGGGCFAIAEYAVIDPQPPFDVMRNNAKWQQWATEQAKAGK